MFFLVNFVYNFIFNFNDSAFCIYWRFNMEQSNSEVIIIGFFCNFNILDYYRYCVSFFSFLKKKERTLEAQERAKEAFEREIIETQIEIRE